MRVPGSEREGRLPVLIAASMGSREQRGARGRNAAAADARKSVAEIGDGDSLNSESSLKKAANH
jgi:hypothetical protein